MRLTPRELATRAFAMTVLAAGWTATALAWPDRAMTRGEAVTLGGCVLASAWLLRHGVRREVTSQIHHGPLQVVVVTKILLEGWERAPKPQPAP